VPGGSGSFDPYEIDSFEIQGATDATVPAHYYDAYDVDVEKRGSDGLLLLLAIAGILLIIAKG